MIHRATAEQAATAADHQQQQLDQQQLEQGGDAPDAAECPDGRSPAERRRDDDLASYCSPDLHATTPADAADVDAIIVSPVLHRYCCFPSQ